MTKLTQVNYRDNKLGKRHKKFSYDDMFQQVKDKKKQKRNSRRIKKIRQEKEKLIEKLLESE